MNTEFRAIHRSIVSDPMNDSMRASGYAPLYTAGPKSRIVIIGQAPGLKAQLSMKPWDDASGRMLRQWLGVSDEDFYDVDKFALIPMDFYYPGKSNHGDLPPRKGFAEKWHPKLFDLMPDVQLTIMVGLYAQKYYLGKDSKANLTETVRNYAEYLPKFFPIVHPSPLNFRWKAKNPWFEAEVVPELRSHVSRVLNG